MIGSATSPTGETMPWTADELVERLRAQGTRYHNLHPFHVRMDAGGLTREELRRWVANRFYYQRCIPIKDAAILSNCPEVDVRREWIKRITDHDGTSPGTGGIESWLRLGETLGVSRGELESERHVLPAVRYAVDAYVDFARRRPWIEAVASSLPEPFGPSALPVRPLSPAAGHGSRRSRPRSRSCSARAPSVSASHHSRRITRGSIRPGWSTSATGSCRRRVTRSTHCGSSWSAA